ncbi:unnamed protein product [Calypogeia fissa]
MPRKIFNGWQCVFLPVGKETRLTRGFEARGGEILSSLNTDSDLVIGDSWEESGREQKRATEQAAYVLWHQKRVAQNLEREKKKLRKKHPYIDWEYPGTPERD